MQICTQVIKARKEGHMAAIKSHPSGKKHAIKPRARTSKKAVTKFLSKGIRLHVGTVRNTLGLSQVEFSRVTGYSLRSIAGWEGGKPLSDSARQKLVETDRLRAALGELLLPQELGEWMRTSNPAFEGQTPIQVMERGESDRLWQMIFQIDANVAN